MKHTVVVKGNKAGLSVLLDPHVPFQQLLQDVAAKFRENAKFWGNVQMTLKLEGRKLTPSEEYQIVRQISTNSQIDIICLIDQDQDNINRCEKTLNEKLMELASSTGQFYKGTLAAGDVLESEVSIVMIGDVEKGAKVVSKGNVIVLGSLRGNVSAGAAGNDEAVIVALEMMPSQLKIGPYIERYQDKKRKFSRHPVMVRVEQERIVMKPMKKTFFPI